MRSLWFQGITLGASLLLALAMLGINVLFGAVGSVSDIEGCGFLSGSLVALLLLYPLAAGLVARSAARLLLRRFPDESGRTIRCGGRIGLLGASLYFLPGLVSLAAGASTPIVLALCLLYTLLSALGGSVGASLAAEHARLTAWRSGSQT